MILHRTSVDRMLDAYIECALWSSTGDPKPGENNGDPLDDDYGPEDIAPETLAKMREDVARFYEQHADIIHAGPDGHDYDSVERAGHDFWLTRNRHGAGFWDGDWPEPAATVLTDAAHVYGEVNLYEHEGRIYA